MAQNQVWKVTEIESPQLMHDFRQPCSHTGAHAGAHAGPHTSSWDNGSGEILWHIISVLKAPGWYVTVAASDSSPLKWGGKGRKGEGLIHLIAALVGTWQKLSVKLEEGAVYRSNTPPICCSDLHAPSRALFAWETLMRGMGREVHHFLKSTLYAFENWIKGISI